MISVSSMFVQNYITFLNIFMLLQLLFTAITVVQLLLQYCERNRDKIC